MMDSFFQDLRSAVRSLAGRPAFSLIVVITLALGIGANTTVFSVLNSVLLHPLPYANPDRLIQVWAQFPKQKLSEFPASEPEYLDYKNQTHVFERMAAFATLPANLTGTDRPERVQTAYVTANLFPLLGQSPILGRVFTENEDRPGSDMVVLLSNGLWRRHFGSSSGVIGKSIQLNGKARTIIGVMPASFEIPDDQTDVWVPLAIDPQNLGGRASHYLQILGKLKAGSTIADAHAELPVLFASWDKDLKGLHHLNAQDHPIKLIPLLEQIVGDTQKSLLILLGAVGFVMLLACANVANLMLARAGARAHEMAIRTALGARRSDLIRQLLTESLLLSSLGGTLGVFLSLWGVDLLSTLSVSYVPRQGEIRLDATVLLATAALSVLTGILCGLAPAWQGSRLRLTDDLKEGGPNTGVGRGEHRLQKWFVVSEVALAVMIVIGAGLLVKSFANLQHVDPGFRNEGVLSLQISLPRSQYPQPQQVAEFYQRLIGELRTLPGVESAGGISKLPLSSTPPPEDISIEGKPMDANGPPQNANVQVVAGDYFKSMSIPVLSGRALDVSDEQGGAAVAVVNQTMAQMFWPREEALGKRLRLGGPRSDSPWLTIVGVVGDVRQNGLQSPAQPEVFVDTLQAGNFDFLIHTMSLVIRSTSDLEALIAPAQQKVWNADRNLPVYHIQKLKQVVDDSLARQRFSVLMMTSFAGFALLLAGMGIYAVLMFSVTRRRQELCIRMALGANPGSLFALIIRQGMVMTGLGMILGLACAAGLSRVVASLLFGITARDASVFTTVSLILAAVALLACFLPARRAMKTNPVTALKYE